MGRYVVLAAALAISCGHSANRPAARLSAQDVFHNSSPAVVLIEAGEQRIGSGFVVDKAGLIATNLHVIAGTSEIQVRFQDGVIYPVTQIANIDPGRDLALLSIAAKKPLPAALTIGDSDRLSPGERVYAIGNPLGGQYENSVSDGLISGIRPWCSDHDVEMRTQMLAKMGPDHSPDELIRELERKQVKGTLTEEESEIGRVLGCGAEFHVLQISVPISQGSSGGALFNQAGEVVGVTMGIQPQGQNINIAVPSKYLRGLVAHLPAPVSVEEFAKATKSRGEEEEGSSESETKAPRREVPHHELGVWDGCHAQDIVETIHQINDAIELGAPVYNDQITGRDPKGFEKCFRVYEGTALKLEQAGACKGVRDAFGNGLLRASSIASFKDKAWAMRDTFDGLIDAAARCSRDPKCSAK